MNLTLGLPEITMMSSLCLYLNNDATTGHIFLGLSLFLAFGRLVMNLHQSEEKKREKESQANNVKDSIMKVASYMTTHDDTQH